MVYSAYTSCVHRHFSHRARCIGLRTKFSRQTSEHRRSLGRVLNGFLPFYGRHCASVAGALRLPSSTGSQHRSTRFLQTRRKRGCFSSRWALPRRVLTWFLNGNVVHHGGFHPCGFPQPWVPDSLVLLCLLCIAFVLFCLLCFAMLALRCSVLLCLLCFALYFCLFCFALLGLPRMHCFALRC